MHLDSTVHYNQLLFIWVDEIDHCLERGNALKAVDKLKISLKLIPGSGCALIRCE